MVGEQINKLAKAEVKRSKKNPTTKEKWLGKLAIAIQRAVSLASEKLFDDDENDSSSNKEYKAEMGKKQEYSCCINIGFVNETWQPFNGMPMSVLLYLRVALMSCRTMCLGAADDAVTT